MFFKAKNTTINLDHVCQIKSYDIGSYTIKVYFSSGESIVDVYNTLKERDIAYKKLMDACADFNERKFPKMEKKETK